MPELIDPVVPPPPKYESILTVNEIAQQLYEQRVLLNLPGTAEKDWEDAERLYSTQPGAIPDLPEYAKLQLAIRNATTERLMKTNKNRNLIKKFFKYRQASHIPVGDLATQGMAERAGCGPAVISYLTGEHPLLVRAKYDKNGLSAEQIRKHLVGFGFEMTEITDMLLKYDNSLMTTPLTTRHLVLLCVRATADKNSWVLLWGDRIIHNWAKIKLNNLTFVNHHIIGRYLLWHPRWLNDHDLCNEIFKSDPANEKRNYEDLTTEQRDVYLRDVGLAGMIFGTDKLSATHIEEFDDGPGELQLDDD